MKKVILFLAIALVLLLPAGSSAQSGGGYTLSWFTVDGGGITWSTGSTYKLGGTSGQADAGSPQTGGNFALQGGFWHAACTPVIVPATITCSGNHVNLAWTANAANKSYAIYRSTSPYQSPDPPNPQAVVTTSTWNDTATTCGNAATNYFYVVRAVCVGAHADDAERAEFDFGLVPGS